MENDVSVRTTVDGRPRSVAWVFYAFLAAASMVAAFSNPIGLLGLVLFASYATYLFRGGRFVLWFF